MGLVGARLVLSTILLGPFLSGCLVGPEPSLASTPVGASQGLVSASHPLAAQVGLDVLRAGGNAVDAAAAVQFALNVVEPQYSGIGGGAFMLLWLSSEGRVVALDGREVAPRAATPDQFLLPTEGPQAREEAKRQGYAVGVPGTLAVFTQSLERFGTLPLADVLAPAIRLAERGVPVDPFLAGLLVQPEYERRLKSWPETARLFYPGTVCPGADLTVAAAVPACVYGPPLRAGDLLQQPDLGQTLRLLAGEGPSAFYHGEIGQALVSTQAQRQGRMTLEDLRAYAVREREPVEGHFGPYTLALMPPPAGGLIVQHLLQLVEPFDLSSHGATTGPGLHFLIEAMRLAYADRGIYLADPDFEPVPVLGLLHPNYVAERRALIDPGRANAGPGAGNPWKYEERPARASVAARSPQAEGNHTTHFVVVDRHGNIASVTSTLEDAFGSGMMVPDYGFLLNNELTDFDETPGGANQVEPGKRPRSSMSPTLVFQEGRPVLTLGSPGGPTIIAVVAQVLLGVLEHDRGLQEAVAIPRVYSTQFPHVRHEPGIPPEALEELQGKGHVPQSEPVVLGNVQAARWTLEQGWHGAADPRRGGAVAYA